MKQKPSMDDAINAAKRMRQELVATRRDATRAGVARLNVFETSSRVAAPVAHSNPPDTPLLGNDESLPSQARPTPGANRTVWVRHTIGLREATSLQLRDAAEAQKRKARYGLLGPGEPSNEQEIADLGIGLALRELGFRS